MRQTLILLIAIVFLSYSCDKKNKPGSNSLPVDNPMNKENSWKVIAAAPVPDIQNVNDMSLKFVQQIDSAYDIVVETLTQLSTYDLKKYYRWQFNFSTFKDIRMVDVAWQASVKDPVTDKIVLQDPVFARSVGLGDDDLYIFHYGGFANISGTWYEPSLLNEIRDVYGAFSENKSFMFMKFKENYAQLTNDDGYRIYYPTVITNMAAGFNSNQNLVTAGYKVVRSVAYEPTFVVTEATDYLQTYPINSVNYTMHPADIKFTKKLSDFPGGLPWGNFSEFTQAGQVITAIISDGTNSAMIDINTDTYEVTKVGDVPTPYTWSLGLINDGEVKILSNHQHHFLDITSENIVKYWNGVEQSDVEMPELKSDVTSHGFYFSNNCLYRLVVHTNNGTEYMYILKREF